jgi:predicted flap endonuclease-1-like 5' DNA nuclease
VKPATPSPAAAGAPIVATVVKPSAVAIIDDLKLIRGIDSAIETGLNKLGVTKYAQIAIWMKPDVARISQALGFRGRVENENWIEQAQILAGGGNTAFSRRRAAGGTIVTPTAAPFTATSVSAVTAPSPVAVVKPAPLAPANPVEGVKPAPIAPAAIGAAIAAAAAATKTGTPAPSAQTTTPIAPSVTNLASPPMVEERAAFANQKAAPPVAVTQPVTPAVPPIVDLPSAAPIRPAAGPARDALQRISGINAEVEKLLNVQGVTRYSHIAGWMQNDVERFDRLLGSTGRIQRESWIDQAQILARGGDTAASREFDRRKTALAPSLTQTTPTAPPSPTATLATDAARDAAARPAKLTDAIRGNQPAAAPRNDMGSLRSVKSEAFQSRPVDAATAAAAAAAAAAGSAKVVRAANLDDLKRIRGIGVLIEKRLNSVGVTSYEQIANWTVDDIGKYSHVLDFKGRIERENWVEQARILASGGYTEFSRRVDRGEVETSKPKA